ncbi:hypothetical protein [Stenomitos frigidus]|nr:hypothetical protein [Stenomitos frigidus]
MQWFGGSASSLGDRGEAEPLLRCSQLEDGNKNIEEARSLSRTP